VDDAADLEHDDACALGLDGFGDRARAIGPEGGDADDAPAAAASREVIAWLSKSAQRCGKGCCSCGDQESAAAEDHVPLAFWDASSTLGSFGVMSSRFHFEGSKARRVG